MVTLGKPRHTGVADWGLGFRVDYQYHGSREGVVGDMGFGAQA